MNSKLAGAFFDLHLDRSMVGMATHFECQKVWIFYPPTPANQQSWVKAHSTTNNDIDTGMDPSTHSQQEINASELLQLAQNKKTKTTLFDRLHYTLEYPLVVYSPK